MVYFILYEEFVDNLPEVFKKQIISGYQLKEKNMGLTEKGLKKAEININNMKSVLTGEGCIRQGDQTVFRCKAEPESEVELVLFSPKSGKELQRCKMDPDPAFGSIRSVSFFNVPEGCTYLYEIDGKSYKDPYARSFHKGIPMVPGEEISFENKFLMIPPEELMIYKLHVRGFTMKAAGIGRKKGTFAGLSMMIPYISKLGFNAVELMPAYEFDETLKVQPYQTELIPSDEKGQGRVSHAAKALKNYWGYAEKNFYFAPKEAYTYGNSPCSEMREMVRLFHEAGIEVILEIYIPYGTDIFLIHDALRMWRLYYGIDGFHLVGQLPFTELASDPLLGTAKLFYDYPDTWKIFGGDIPKMRHIYTYNDEFQSNVRALLKSDESQTGAFAAHFRENPSYTQAVHFTANNNGFTLYDSVSYDWKHNEENGENNADGSNANFSWNCGAEGPCRKKTVRNLRARQVRNALLCTFLSQAVPLLYAGDEGYNTQNGNNNAYALDQTTGWTDWHQTKEAKYLREFTAKLIAFRKKHPIFHMKKELRGNDYRSYGIPDISFHDENAWVCSFENNSRTLAILLNGRYTLEEGKEEDDLFYAAFNAYWDKHSFALPVLPEGYAWHPAIDSSAEPGREFAEETASPLEDQRMYISEPRSVVILCGRKTITDTKEN